MAGESTVQVERHLFTVEDHYRMGDAGILGEDDRVELIDGEIVQMPPIDNPHAATVDELNGLLTEHLTRRQAFVRVQNPLHISNTSVPQPDVTLLQPRLGSYRTVAPGPSDVLLLIEVADTSISYDRLVKLPLYAQAGVAEVWIVDLEAQTVEVNRRPASGEYTSRIVAGRGSSISPLAFPEVRLSIDEIIGPEPSA